VSGTIDVVLLIKMLFDWGWSELSGKVVGRRARRVGIGFSK
jgi:hypothetical protein